jgi:hypothetical protein
MIFWQYFDTIFPGMLQLTTLCISFDEDDYTSIHVWKDFVAVGHPCGWPVLVLFILHCFALGGQDILAAVWGM